MVKKNYKREIIRLVLNAYMEKMKLAFIDGGRVCLPGIGTLIPELLIPEGSYYNLPACNKKDIAPPYTNLRFSRNQNLKNDMNRRLPVNHKIHVGDDTIENTIDNGSLLNSAIAYLKI